MGIIERIAEFHDDVTTWRRDIHAHPELGFEEQRTSDFVAQKLAEFGYEVHRSVGRTGVVGRLRAGASARSIGLRADMDALPIEEATNLPYRSRHQGRMHACGHDGHTAMLLGAARYLAATRNFDGTVNLIFQPAEEGLGGGEAMVRTGYSSAFRATRSLACTTGRGSQSASFRSAPAR
jgi:amidohydrolase